MGFIEKHFAGKLLDEDFHERLRTYLPDVALAADEIARYYETRDFARATRRIMALAADQVNQYLDHYQPWKLAKHGKEREPCGVYNPDQRLFACSRCISNPSLPKLAQRAKSSSTYAS